MLEIGKSIIVYFICTYAHSDGITGNKIASNTTTLCQSNYSHAEQHIESNTIDLPESQSIEFRSTEDNSINSPQSKTGGYGL